MRSQRGQVGIERDCKKLGFEKIYLGDRRTVWRMKCSQCDATVEFHYQPRRPPRAMEKQLLLQGWDVGANQDPLCGDCRRARKRKFQAERQETLPSTLTSVTALSAATKGMDMAQIGPTSDMVMDVTLRLVETFDKTTHRFKDDWSDAKIARELGTSEDIVAGLRRKKFGELAEDPTVTKLVEMIDTVRTELLAMVDQYRQQLNSLHMDVGAQDALVREQMAEGPRLKERIEKSISKLREDCGAMISEARKAKRI